jgi:hypothetical protein
MGHPAWSPRKGRTGPTSRRKAAWSCSTTGISPIGNAPRSIIYANFKAQRDGILDSGFLRFYGTAELHEAGPIHEAIFRLLLPREQTHVGADTGIGVLVKIDRAADVRGKPLP